MYGMEDVKIVTIVPLMRYVGAIKAGIGQHIALDDEGVAVDGPKLVALEKVRKDIYLSNMIIQISYYGL